MQLLCPSCKSPIVETYFYCPKCGKLLHEPPVSISIAKQIGIYSLSFLLPPFGLMPGLHYLRLNDTKAKTVGAIALVLTFVSIAISLYIVIDSMNKYSQILQSATR